MSGRFHYNLGTSYFRRPNYKQRYFKLHIIFSEEIASTKK